MRSRLLLLTSLLLTAALPACTQSPAAPTNSAAYSQADLTVGSGATAAAGNAVVVDYTGWLYDASKADRKGPVFETSLGAAPFGFLLGSGQVIDGWELGVTGMREGGKRRLVIPAGLAYGSGRNGSLPPYATLIFEIDLISVTVPAN